MGNLNLRSMMEQKNKNVPLPISKEELESRLNRNQSSGNSEYGGGYSKPYPNGEKNKKAQTQTQARPAYSQPTSSPSYKPTSSRTGMSDVTWHWVLKITDFVTDLIKSSVVILGILAANIADTVMGSIAVSLLVRPEIQQYSNYNWINPMNFGIILSLGASSIQIYMWSLIQKRNIPLNTLINPKNWKYLPKEIGGFLAFAGLLWVIDTFLDVSPMFVFYTSAVYGSTGLYPYLVAGVTIIVVILCGFAEILTSNMRGMFGLQSPK